MPESSVVVISVTEGTARVHWSAEESIDQVQQVVASMLAEHGRVEAVIAVDDTDRHRSALWSGMRREGVLRGVTVDGVTADHVLYARLTDDVPAHEPEGFRSLLNSFLPRKRAISQMLVRDEQDRVLLCQLTYKQDWDLPGGVVEVGEAPHVAVSREVEEELGLEIPTGRLLLTDWLPPWSGWDDALCLVFDGGCHPPDLLDAVVREVREIRDAEFCALDQVAERCSPITAARIGSALANLDGTGSAYAVGGRTDSETGSGTSDA